MCSLVDTPLAFPEAKLQAGLELDLCDSLTSSTLNNYHNSLLHGCKWRRGPTFQQVINMACVFLIMLQVQSRSAFMEGADSFTWHGAKFSNEVKPAPKRAEAASSATEALYQYVFVFFWVKMHKLGDVFHKLESKRFFSLPCSRKTGHYTVQQIPNSHGERHGSSSSSSDSGPLPVPKPSAASYPGCRSRPGSSPRHSPNFRSRPQPQCQRCNSQVGTKLMFTSVSEQFHGGSHTHYHLLKKYVPVLHLS